MIRTLPHPFLRSAGHIWVCVVLIVVATQCAAQRRPSHNGIAKVSGLRGARARKAAGGDLVDPPLPLFLPGLRMELGTDEVHSMSVTDLNHDGRLDVVAVNLKGVQVMLGNGDGTLQSAVVYDSGGFIPESVAVADLNHDSKLDVVVVNQCGYQDGNCSHPSIGVLLGNGNGTLQPAVIYPTGGFQPDAIAIADFNGDGQPDLVVINCNLPGPAECAGDNVGAVAILLGNGDGTFQDPVSYGSGGYSATAVSVGDLNGDHKLDLVVSNLCAQSCLFDGEGEVSVLLGNGDGTFQSAMSYDSAATDARDVIAADVNGDGKVDVVVANCLPTGRIVCGGPDGVVSVLIGNGDGTMQPALTYGAIHGTPWSLAVADVDADGKADIALADVGADVLRGNGDGTFQTALNSGTGVAQKLIEIADMNGDGRPDLITSNQCQSGCTSNVDVLLHTGTVASVTTLTSTPNPAVYGQETFTATVNSGSETPGGSVTFYAEIPGNTYPIGSVTLSGGVAVLPGANTGFGVGTGTNTIAAVYQGSLKFHPSLSPVIQQVITPATTTTTLTSSSNPGVVPKAIVYTVSVTSQYGGAVTGNVSCQDNGTNIPPVRGQPLKFQKKYTAPGTHTIACSFNGDSDNLASNAPPLTERIVYPTATSLKSSGSPSHVGQPVTYTATVTSKYSAIPNGETVTFTYGKTVLGTAPLANGVAALTTAALPQGTRVVKATYPGDATLNTSNGKVTQVVEP